MLTAQTSRVILVAFFVTVATVSCTKQEPLGTKGQGNGGSKRANLETVKVVIDDKAIATLDGFSIIDPIVFATKIDGSLEEYEASVAKLSRGQRLLLGVVWYTMEVNNGGHHQFYLNSTGMVWEDAHNGFMAIEMPEVAGIIAESAKRMGGRPSFNRIERNRILEQKTPIFEDLDDRIFKISGDVDAKMLKYIRSHPKDFYFDGEVKRLAPR